MIPSYTRKKPRAEYSCAYADLHLFKNRGNTTGQADRGAHKPNIVTLTAHLCQGFKSSQCSFKFLGFSFLVANTTAENK